MEEKRTILSIVENYMKEEMKHKGEATEALKVIQDQVEREKKKLEKAEAENRLKTLRLIKSELTKKNDKLEYTLTEEAEKGVLVEMKKERAKFIKKYKEANRDDLADELKQEVAVIKEFLPGMPDDEEVVEFINQVIDEFLSTKEAGYKLTPRDMGSIVKPVRAKYKDVDGSLIKETLEARQ